MNLAHLQANWKSTISGILTVILATISALLALPSVQTLVSPKTLLILGGVSAVGKVWMALITQDAGTVIANVPGKTEPVVVPSHEVPDSPVAKAVLPEVKP